MIRVEWYCKRCGKLIESKEYGLAPGYEEVSPDMITDQFYQFCENCLVEYEALKCRQKEERRMFFEEMQDGRRENQ